MEHIVQRIKEVTANTVLWANLVNCASILVLLLTLNRSKVSLKMYTQRYSHYWGFVHWHISSNSYRVHPTGVINWVSANVGWCYGPILSVCFFDTHSNVRVDVRLYVLASDSDIRPDVGKLGWQSWAPTPANSFVIQPSCRITHSSLCLIISFNLLWFDFICYRRHLTTFYCSFAPHHRWFLPLNCLFVENIIATCAAQTYDLAIMCLSRYLNIPLVSIQKCICFKI